MTLTGRRLWGGLAWLLLIGAAGCAHDAAPRRSPQAARGAPPPAAAPSEPVAVPPAPAAPPAAAPAPVPAPPASEAEVERERYFVYDDLIRAEYWVEGIDLIVVSERTVIGHGAEGALANAVGRMREMLPRPQPETIADFERRNAEAHPLRADLIFRSRPVPAGKDRIVLGPEVRLISEQETKKLFEKGDGWKRFYAAHPRSQGILAVSAVGFNAARTEALLYVGNQSHWLAGAGFYVLMEKRDGNWEIAAKDGCWIS